MFVIFQKVKSILTPQERVHLMMLASLVCTSAFLETFSVASILPYMSLLAAPDSEISLRVFEFASRMTGETLRDRLVIYVGFATLFFVIVGTLFSGLTTWFVLRFSLLRVHSLSQRILISYLARDYEFFIQRNSAVFLKNLLSEVGTLVGGVMTPLIQMITRVLVVLLMVTLLLIVNFEVAFVSMSIFLGFYIIIYALTRRNLSRMGVEGVAANESRYKILSELFGGIREIKLWKKERYYFSLFSSASERFADVNSKSQLLALVPRYIIEVLAFGGIVVITIMIAGSGDTFANYIPILSLYAVAGYKLLPSLQQIFVNLSSIRYSAASLDTLLEEKKVSASFLCDSESNEVTDLKLNLNQEIRFEDLTYTYPGAEDIAVGPLNFSIPAFRTTGIIGSSGAGKSTILDLMLGLLKPTSGNIYVDDQVLDEKYRQIWAARVGYVPQSIYLTDGTVAENIAFGIPSKDIDRVAVASAARTAQIEDVINGLPQKFDTHLGERGLRLSGGQRQRIAIARALYRDPKILIFDEATSALDSETEESIMESLRSLAHSKTIVIVTHRLSTLRDCDRLYLLEGGMLITDYVNLSDGCGLAGVAPK